MRIDWAGFAVWKAAADTAKFLSLRQVRGNVWSSGAGGSRPMASANRRLTSLLRGGDMLKLGAPLRFPIRDANGLLLLAQGCLINDRLRQILQVRGISLEIQASLKLLQGGQVGLEIPINKPVFNVGRRPECDLKLNSDVVSGLHCQITKTKFEVLLSDLNSINGTFVNGGRLTKAIELSNEDQIRIGHFIFKVQFFATMATDSSAGETALKAWVLEATSPTGRPTSAYSRTVPDLDLDSFAN